MRPRRLIALVVTAILVVGGIYIAAPYARAASLFVRAANLGGRVEALADATARTNSEAARAYGAEGGIPRGRSDLVSARLVLCDFIRKSQTLGSRSCQLVLPRLT